MLKIIFGENLFKKGPVVWTLDLATDKQIIFKYQFKGFRGKKKYFQRKLKIIDLLFDHYTRCTLIYRG